ncbi:MAG TPA: hypothetical protein VGR55_04290 [Candidatus Acidoferrum sp.]|nr:hypothetical protein [Candidatus Acidoferrum sp.]
MGLVVEGTFDGPTYRTLIARIRNISALQIRECGGKSRLKHKFVYFLKELQRNAAWQIDIALVIRDSDCDPPQPIEKQLRNILSASGFKPEMRVEFFAIPCMLESWLLSDVDAIRTVAANREHGVVIAPPNIQIAQANSSGDKEVFTQVLEHFRLPATPPVYEEIAALASLSLIGNRCNYFREFTRRVKAI